MLRESVFTVFFLQGGYKELTDYRFVSHIQGILQDEVKTPVPHDFLTLAPDGTWFRWVLDPTTGQVWVKASTRGSFKLPFLCVEVAGGEALEYMVLDTQ